MKKLIILILIVFVLTGCKTTRTDILTKLDQEIVVCEDVCMTDQTSISDTIDDFINIVETHIPRYDEYDNDNIFLSGVDGLFLKQDVMALDLIPTNLYIPDRYIPITEPYEQLRNKLNTTVSIASKLLIQEGEQYNQGLPATNTNYGVDTTSGFYQFTILSGTEQERIEDFKFIVTSDDIQFESIEYYPQKQMYSYKIFQDDIYREYLYFYNHQSTFTYMNLKTFDYIKYQTYGELEAVEIYNPDSKYLFSKNQTDFKVSKFNNYEFVASLEKRDTEYPVAFNLRYANGWDSFRYISNSSNVEIFNNESLVFESYNLLTSQHFRYFSLTAGMTLSQEEFDLYQFPTEFAGDTSIDMLNEKLNWFMDLAYPLDSIGLKSSQIQDMWLEIFDTISSKYS